jgi:beta-lactamase regulating signal transducer with metallopeptidase domain
MISAVLDHLWQSTLLALGVGVLSLAFSKARASVRHGLWLAASAKFLVPFAALAALGKLLAPALHPPVQTGPHAVLIERAVQPFSRYNPFPSAAHTAAGMAHALDPYAILFGVWALGCIAILAYWVARWVDVSSAVRRAAPLAMAAPMPVLASSGMREPGLVGLWRPVLLVPDTLFDHLAPAQVEALVAHEACHLRRRDNLAAAAHMLVEALFWFHPLVWWVGARLIEERERACDEAVVREGHDRAAYATGLVECCRLFLQSPLSCVAGASGSDLTRRVDRIMAAPALSPLSRAGKTVLLTAGVCAAASPVAAGWLASPSGRQAMAQVTAVASRAPAARVLQAPPTLSPAAHPARGTGKPETIQLAQDKPIAETDAGDRPISEPSPISLQAQELSLAPVAGVELSRSSLIRVSDQTPEAGQGLGPGHYVERSGLRQSGGCGGEGPAYTFTTRPIAPGHIITNFRYELIGDNRCAPSSRSGAVTAYCKVMTDRPDRKVVGFALFADRNSCFVSGAFANQGTSQEGAEDYGETSSAHGGAVTQSEMVISYDVQ